MNAPRLLVAGLSGGSGKTIVSLGVVGAWRREGLTIAPFKKGPDYIDAAWLTRAAARPCRNLDLFMQPPDIIRASFATAAGEADMAVIEGNRGLYDGLDSTGSCSSAELAKLLDVPVILVVDCTKVTRTVAAQVLGCQRLDPGVEIAGVVLNRVAGPRHRQVIEESIADICGLPVLGAVPRLREDPLPERHLGLVPPPEHGAEDDALGQVAGLAGDHLDLEAIRDLAGAAGAFDVPEADAGGAALPVAGAGENIRIGVFHDAAFQFYYPENLEALSREGAELIDVSPIHDRDLPEVEALYIGGGFPETLAPALAANESFKRSLGEKVAAGLPVYAECGGAVYLGRTLHYEGSAWPMAGIMEIDFIFSPRPQGHGYVELETAGENPFFPSGEILRGHEFHYTGVKGDSYTGLPFAFRVMRGHGFDGERDGLCCRNVLATYTHLHALGSPAWAPGLVRAALRYRSAAGTANASNTGRE